jgi:dTDP-4-amino-4,6-dideoxygalactose transaminase
VATEAAGDLIGELHKERIQAARLYTALGQKGVGGDKVCYDGKLSGARSVAQKTVYLPGHAKVKHSTVAKIKRIVAGYV